MGENESSTDFGRAVVDSHSVNLGAYEIKITAYQNGTIMVDPHHKGAPFSAMLSKQITTKNNPGWKKQVEDALVEMTREINLMDRARANIDLSLDFLRVRTPKTGE